MSKTKRAASTVGSEAALPGDPLWYKDAVIYQLHVRSFFDSDGDGIGDFRGLTQKLDYLQDLGVTAVWLLPFYPSPLKDDGYDIASYTEINNSYGTMKDFKNFIREAHSRGLRVITELVINHTSDQHPWFQRARHAKPGSSERDFYVWSDTPEKYQDARIIFKDFETSNWTWDPIAKAYYWHRFYSHQPDLNFENPRVQKAVFELLGLWLDMGVDGLRLDAVPYLYEEEGTNCENLPRTHEFLKALRAEVDKHYSDRMLLAEANQWPEDAIAYFGDGDECHTAFHFPVMPRLFMAIHQEDRFPIVDIMHQTPAIPDQCQWLIFLRNHDELTLEMVTDDERDYMYRVYARDRQARINLGIRRRLAPLLSNNRRKIELMNGLLCALPGTPVIYYGDEIGMGDNIYLGDRHGVRTPMQWSPDRNAGFSEANPQRLYSPVIIDSEYLFATINVETQQKNPHSLLWWMKRLIALRQNYIALRRGTMDILTPENGKVLAFTRDYEDQSVLMVANLSRFVQHCELDLSRFAGRRPVEMFGQSVFPVVGKSPYAFTLGPHAFYWFSLEHEQAEAIQSAEPTRKPAQLSGATGWQDLLTGRAKRLFEAALRDELPRQRWFHSWGRPLQNIQVFDAIPLGRSTDRQAPGLFIVRAEFTEGEPEAYVFTLAAVWGQKQIDDAANGAPPAILFPLHGEKEPGLLYDATLDRTAARALLELMIHRRRFKGVKGELTGWSTPDLDDIVEASIDLGNLPLRMEPRDGGVIFGDKLIFKLSRRAESGTHPDLEIGRYLAQCRGDCPPTLKVLGAIDYRTGEDSTTVGVLLEYVPNSPPAQQVAVDAIGRFLEITMALPESERPQTPLERSYSELATGAAAPRAQELLGGDLEWSALLGRRTAELHVALTSRTNADFMPEPFSQLYQRSLYQASRKATLRTFQQVRRLAKSLPEETQAVATAALAREKSILDQFNLIVGQKLEAQRIRCHGDFHLGHVLYTGKDFLIVDFDGDPGVALSTRRVKRSPLADVAAMIHSLEAAGTMAVRQYLKSGVAKAEAADAWREAGEFWSKWASSAFLRAYLSNDGVQKLLPAEGKPFDRLLSFLLFQEAIEHLQKALDDGAPESIAIALERIALLPE